MVTIELPDETAAALEAKAAAAGLNIAGYLALIASGSISGETVDSVERLQRWRELMQSIRVGQPPLDKDERLKHWQDAIDAIPPADHWVDDSRESIYPDRS
jgi:hypothetical protein